MRSKSQVGGIERKLSVLDDASSDGKTSDGATKHQEKIKERIELSKGVRDMHFEIAFDSRLRDKASILRDKTSQKHYNFQKKVVSRVKFVTIIIYYFVVPYFETPDWCLKYF